MKRLCLVGVLLLGGVGAADARPDTRELSCSQAQALVNERGGITLSTGRFTYDRFVSSRRFCTLIQTRATPVFVPTADTRHCRLLSCRSQTSMDGRR